MIQRFLSSSAYRPSTQLDSHRLLRPVDWSPPCETMSVSLSKRGRQKHRHSDRRAKSAIAIKHDHCFENIIGILERLVAANSAVLVSVENPRSPSFLSKSSLQRLAQQPGWRLVDYCKNADCCDDSDHDSPRRASPRASSCTVLSPRLRCRCAITIVRIALCKTLAGTEPS
jgi:hypothetical protein